MTLEELSKYDINQILSNGDLLYTFKELYKKMYGKYPDCTSCAISSEFRKLFIINEEMEKTFIYKTKGEIISYINPRGRKVRSYDSELSEEFVIGYLTPNKYTSAEEIEVRMKEFKKLPSFIDEVKPEPQPEVITSSEDAQPEVVVEQPKNKKKTSTTKRSTSKKK